ncbi:hypothetical protein ACGFW5_20475 [Streptomyces sp. NPDC048416]|uniref:hypothetical protein n=1 Tax=Streptomyces sp. NPDC048416 TaxID=3365546 RepID=UPI003711E5E8
MILVSVLILVAVLAPLLLLALAPAAPARRNPSILRRNRSRVRRLGTVPEQQTSRRHAR